jgi:NTE family protein
LNERLFAQRDTHVEVAPKTGSEPPGPKDMLARIPGKSCQLSETHRQPKRMAFDRVVLLLQGGGALGAYQAGVYEALAEANLHPDWVAGISIGAFNATIIAGNPPNLRVEKLRELWQGITHSWFDVGAGEPSSLPARGDSAGRSIKLMSAVVALMNGAPGFFRPRILNPWFHPPGTVEATSYYDTARLKATLESLIDFDRVTLNKPKPASASAPSMCGAETWSISTRRPRSSSRSM